MMSLIRKLETMAEALTPICDTVFHYWRPRPEGVDRYIIWAEDQEAESLEGDNQKLEQGIHGSIDLFTKNEFDPLIDIIQVRLNMLENVSWRLNSSQYEEETGLVHYEWYWNMR